MRRNFKAEIQQLIERLKEENLSDWEREVLEAEVLRLGKLEMKLNRKKGT